MAAPVLQFKRGLLANLPGLRAGEPGFTTDSYDLYVGIDSTSSNNKFFGSHRYWTKGTASTGSGVNFVEGTTNGTQYVTLKAPDSLSGITTFTLPATDGSNGYILTTNGSGTLSFSAPSASSFTIAGDTGTDTFNTGETLTFAGTASEIETTVTNNQVQIGLPNNVTVAGVLTASNGAVVRNVQIGINGANVIDTSTGNLTLNSAGGSTIIDDNVRIQNNLTVDGNLSIGGTIISLIAQDVLIKDKDIVLGYTTSITGSDASTDASANHGGIAIASTEGSPLASFTAAGINTLADTYKQMMWFRSGTLGFSTDAFAFNYGVAVGTTSMANGLRFKVGSGITMTDTVVSATTFIGALTGNVTGNASSATYATTAGISTRAQTVDTTTTSTNAYYPVPFVSTNTGTNGETVRVGAALSVNPSTGDVRSKNDLVTGSGYLSSPGGTRAMYLYDTSGNVSFQGKVIANNYRSSSNGSDTLTFVDLDATFARNIKIVGITTVGTLKLNGTSGIGITGISSSTTLAENSNDYLPTQAAVKAYVDAVDVTTGIAGDTGTGTVSTSQTLTVAGTANQVTTTASGQTITVSLPSTVIVGTALSAPTHRASTIQHLNGTTAATIDTSGNLTAAQDLTITGNLYVNGSTTQVNTTTATVEDRTLELGIVDGSAPSSTTTWDLGVLFNYYDGSAKKSALVWEQADARFKLGSVVSDGGGTGNSNPQITFTTYAALEIGELWINGTCTGGSSQVIACSGSNLILQNITIDAGTF